MKQCPSCGRPINFEEKYSRILACGYCNAVLEFGKGEITKIGEQSEFIDFPSLFEVGKTLDWNGKKTSVKGQLRYEYDGGFFDVFFVNIEGKSYYIQEDDGMHTVMQNSEWMDSTITLVDKVAGATESLGGKDVFVQENGLFTLSGMKGFVDSELIPGEKYEYLDGIVNGKVYHFEKVIGKDKMRINKEVSL